MTASFLNRDRYVKVTDLDLGKEGSYTDYEELAFTDTDTPPFQWLVSSICSHGYMPWNYNKTEEEWAVEQRLWQDRADVIFHCCAHVISAWIDCDGQEAVTKERVDMLVDSARNMLDGTLNTEWLMRSGHDWADLKRQYEEERDHDLT